MAASTSNENDNRPLGPRDFSDNFYNNRVNGLGARIINDHCKSWTNLAIAHSYFDNESPVLRMKKMHVDCDVILPPNHRHTISAPMSYRERDKQHYLLLPFLNDVGLNKLKLNGKVVHKSSEYQIQVVNRTNETRTIRDQSTIAYVGLVDRP